MLAYDIKWIAPMKIGAHHGSATTVEGPMQALAILTDNWPTTGRKHHEAALRECALACRQLGRSEKSREAFMAAALEAGVLVFAAPTHKTGAQAVKRPLYELPVGASIAS